MHIMILDINMFGTYFLHGVRPNENAALIVYIHWYWCKMHTKFKEYIAYPCQGFTKSHSGLGLNGLQPQGLKEYSDSYLISDYLGPILGSKCLVMQITSNYLGLRPSEGTSEKMFQVATRTFNLLYYFSFMYTYQSHFSG
jgi:hypothetical protein